MAIFHLTTKVVSRKQGQSAIAAAAYRSGKELSDEQTGEIKSYTRRAERVIFEGVFAPEGAPEWAKDRQQLWNHAERNETRKDSRLAREVEFALPYEMTDIEREWLVKDFVREQFTRKGLVVDASIHGPEQGKDERNYHCHLLMTTRTVGPDGFAPTIDLEQKRVETLTHWRKEWAHLANRHLERHGYAARIDHRSLAEQGIDREPTLHLGYASCEMAARGKPSDRFDQLIEIMGRNDAIRLREQGARERADEKEKAALAAMRAAPFSSADRPWEEIKPERAAQRENRELAEQQKAERKKQQEAHKRERAELKKQLGEEMEAFRAQSRKSYRKASDKAWREMSDRFKGEWKELFTTTPAAQREEAKAALTKKQREELAERRKELFKPVRAERTRSWSVAQRKQAESRTLLREAQKADRTRLDNRHFDEWQTLREQRQKEWAEKARAYDRQPAPSHSGGMAATQTQLLDYIARRAERHRRDAQRAHNRMADAAHGRKDQLANMARLGRAEGLARHEVTGQKARPVLPADSAATKAQAATEQRIVSGKEFSAAFQEFLARQSAKPRNEGNTSERDRDKDRDGRSRERGGRGGRER